MGSPGPVLGPGPVRAGAKSVSQASRLQHPAETCAERLAAAPCPRRPPALRPRPPAAGLVARALPHARPPLATPTCIDFSAPARRSARAGGRGRCHRWRHSVSGGLLTAGQWRRPGMAWFKAARGGGRSRGRRARSDPRRCRRPPAKRVPLAGIRRRRQRGVCVADCRGQRTRPS